MKNQVRYKCTQQQLYAVANLGWQNYLDNLTDFTNYKAKYTAALGNDAIAAVLAAKNLPNEQARGSVPESLRIQVVQAGLICLDNWQKLKGYINEAFPGMQKPKLQAAGSAYYRQASNEGWEQMQSMLTSASTFIVDNSPALSQGGDNMPAAFPAKFEADKTDFESKYTAYLNASLGSVSSTGNKIAANNAVYDALLKMFADGQIIYRTDAMKKMLFVFDTLIGFVSVPGATGLRIVAKEKLTALPLPGLAVTAQPGNIQGTTDENGVLVLSMPENTYSITGIKAGYQTFTEEVDITTGVVSRREVELAQTA